MNDQVDKTKVNSIAFLDYEKTVQSYRWENANTKNTFPVDFWVPALFEKLYHGRKNVAIEKDYVQRMPRITKPTNAMYINSLLKKFVISSEQDFLKIRQQFSESELEDWIVNYINSIVERFYSSASPRSKKWMDDWKIYAHKYTDTFDKYDIDQATILMFRAKTSAKNKPFNWEKIDFDAYKDVRLQDVKLFDSKADHKNENATQIGALGEQYFYDALVSKYGFNNVIHKSGLDKFSPYDFEVMVDGFTHYFEVKSTTSTAIRFFISMNEIQFRKSIKANDKYSLILIKDINLSGIGELLPKIVEIENPEFEINLEKYGIFGKKIIVAPHKFIGRA